MNPDAFADAAAGKELARARKRERRQAERAIAEHRRQDELLAELDALPPPAAGPNPDPAAVRLVTGPGLPDLPGAPRPKPRGAALAAFVSHYQEEEGDG